MPAFLFKSSSQLEQALAFLCFQPPPPPKKTRHIEAQCSNGSDMETRFQITACCSPFESTSIGVWASPKEKDFFFFSMCGKYGTAKLGPESGRLKLRDISGWKEVFLCCQIISRNFQVLSELHRKNLVFAKKRGRGCVGIIFLLAKKNRQKIPNKRKRKSCEDECYPVLRYSILR